MTSKSNYSRKLEVMMKNKKNILGLNITLAGLFVATTVCMADPTPPSSVITKAEAERIALKDQKGKVQASDLEFENNIWTYSLEILGSDKKIHEVNVNALNGKIVSKVVENAATEAKEKVQDPN